MPLRPTSDLIAPGSLDAGAVKAHLESARSRVLALTGDLGDERLLGPKLPIVNPILWELGHLAWFQEHWCLRQREDGTRASSIVAAADALYDSTAIPHDTRWELPLPTLKGTRKYLDAVLDEVSERLLKTPENDRLLYFAELAACHEDMHAEAFHYTRQTLAYPAPPLTATTTHVLAAPAPGDAEFSGGRFLLGAARGTGFVFDNEKWAHEIELSPFRLARQAVTNSEYAEFVDAGGYRRREWWSEEGWSWRDAFFAPRYWEKRDGVWGERRFDRWRALALDEPVIHVSWHEADAFCRFARRRLPTEAEWEFAACNGETAPKPVTPWGGARANSEQANLEASAPVPVAACAGGDSPRGCRQLLGNVWEWTASTFAPYPGFVADPYQEYSAPWFGTHKVLRGGSFATPARLVRTTWRNFYTPDRYDIFAGFRTCAL